MVHLLDHADLQRQIAAECRAYAKTCAWENAYANFWNSQAEAGDVDLTDTPAVPVAPATGF